MKTPNYDRALKKFGKEICLAAKRELGIRTIGKNKSYGQATGMLKKSLRWTLSKRKELIFGSSLPYADFIYWGVSGTKRKIKDSPFSYGSKMPPLEAIKQWMQVKPVRLRDEDGKFISQQPYMSKRTGKKVDPMDSPAYLIARAIQKRGIDGLKYWDIAYNYQLKKHQKKLTNAYAKDLEAHSKPKKSK